MRKGEIKEKSFPELSYNTWFLTQDNIPETDVPAVQVDNNLIDLLKQKNQIILQGAPGTGKTYTAKDIAEQLIFKVR